MIKLSGLLQGEDFTIADVFQTVIEEKAPSKPLRWMLDSGPIDWEATGFVLNPDFIPDSDSAEPRNWVCAHCNTEFISHPIVHGEKVVLIPVLCESCDDRQVSRHQDFWNMLRAGVPRKISFVNAGGRSFEKVKIVKFFWTPLSRTYITGSEMKDTTTPAGSAALEVVSVPQPLGPTSHAKRGPSSLKYIEQCPHWMNSGGTSDAAEEGTKLHERLVSGDLSGLTEEQISAVVAVANVFAQVRASLGEGAVSLVERRVNVCGLTFGTADELILSAPRGAVVDAKFGRIAVDDAETNIQGWAYAVGLFYEFPTVDEVTVLFAQPRCDEVSSHTFTRKDDYERMKLRIELILLRAEDPTSPYNPSPVTCQYCGNKARCEALHQLALKVAPNVSSFAIPEHLKVENLTTGERMGAARVLADILGEWAEEVKKASTALALDGHEIPGYTLTQRNSPRECTNPAAAFEVVKGTVSAEQFMSVVKRISIPELEKLFAANAPRGKKAQAKQELDDLLTDAGAIRQEGEIHFLRKLSPTKQTIEELPAN